MLLETIQIEVDNFFMCMYTYLCLCFLVSLVRKKKIEKLIYFLSFILNSSIKNLIMRLH